MWVCKTPNSQTLARDARPFDVVAIGENSVDVLVTLPEWPGPDAKLAVDGLAMVPGGQVATAAVACAKLGARTRYLGVVGADPWGGIVRTAFEAAGVDARLIVRDGAPTRSAVVLVDEAGRRTILGHRDARLALRESEIDEVWLSSARVLMIDATDVPAALAAATKARRAGLAVMLDVDRPGPAADSLIAVSDIVITSADFPQAHTGCPSLGAALDELERRHRPAVLIATLGAEGAIARAGGEEIVVGPPAVDVIDTTGAGDAFRGAFAASWIALGEAAELAELVRRAVIAGALSCRAVGAQTALPSLTELQKWL